MKFSIIIPVYNVEKYLEQCLNSVLNQTFADYEVICVNDGSTDGSLIILNNFSKKNVRFQVISQENGGLSDARNAGIKAAKGDYIFLLDSDDWIVENALEILNENIGNQDFIVFNGKRFFEDDTTEMPDKGISEQQLTGWEYYNKYALVPRKFHFVCTVLRLYRREFLLENELFFKKGIYHEDNLFTPVCCYYAKNIKVLPNILYIYRIRAGSITQTPNKQRIIDTIRNANDLAEFFIPRNIDKNVVYREIAGMYFSVFMPPKNIVPEKEIRKQINWEYYKKVSTYSRHRKIYFCLSIHYRLFQLFIWIEKMIKNLTK